MWPHKADIKLYLDIVMEFIWTLGLVHMSSKKFIVNGIEYFLS